MLFEKNHKMLCVPLAHIIVPLTLSPKVYRSVIAKHCPLFLSVQRTICHYNADSLPGDCHATLAMTQYFVRNGTRVCLLKDNSKIYILS